VATRSVRFRVRVSNGARCRRTVNGARNPYPIATRSLQLVNSPAVGAIVAGSVMASQGSRRGTTEQRWLRIYRSLFVDGGAGNSLHWCRERHSCSPQVSGIKGINGEECEEESSRWLIEVDKSAWDGEIERDFAEGGAGALLLDEIRKDFKAGHCRKWE
jgi:hypothetical protein